MLALLAIIGCLSLFAGFVMMAGAPEAGGFKYVAVGAVLLLIWSCIPAISAESHTHEGAAGKFYQTWTMPDNRAVSCCHSEDCSSAEAYQKNGKWYARQTGDIGEFTEIPPNKVELDRDSPDGRNHLCGRKYTFMGAGSGFTVFCFIAGAGG